ncbi:MAG TPA: hypothetical protein VIP09_04510 [Dehalococcoidia bacterium]|jgi:4,5-dihydroxyphthalate decarboxylase
MNELELTFATKAYDRVVPVISGEVEPEGVSLRYVGPRSSPDIFYDQLKFQRYDISEMSFSSYLRVRAKGWPYSLLPVFHHRTYAYASMLIRKGSGIRQNHPEDLKGKQVGLADYQQTAGLCGRGILQHEFGVKPTDMTWYQERSPQRSHGGASGMTPPKNLDFHYAEADFGTMFDQGELDAVIHQPHTSSVMDRTDLIRHPKALPLFSDPRKECFRYYRKSGVLPAHHVTVIRDSILQEHPWVSAALVNAFEQAKQLAEERRREQLLQLPAAGSLTLFSEFLVRDQDKTFGGDPYPYGIQNNAEMIDLLQTFSVEQGLTSAKQPWQEMFPEELLLMENISLKHPAAKTRSATPRKRK